MQVVIVKMLKMINCQVKVKETIILMRLAKISGPLLCNASKYTSLPGKNVVDFLLVTIELFKILNVTTEALHANSDWKSPCLQRKG